MLLLQRFIKKFKNFNGIINFINIILIYERIHDKIIIALIALYVLFKITIGALVDNYISKIRSFTDHSRE